MPGEDVELVQAGRQPVGTTVAMELSFGWVVATAAVLALRDVPAAGAEVLTVVGVLTLGFGLAYARLGRALR